MISMMSRINLITNQLNNKLEMIRNARGRIGQTYKSTDKAVTDFRYNISYYVHYIYSTPELKDTFEALLFYRQKAKEDKVFTTVLEQVADNIQKLGKYLSELPNFEEKCQKVNQERGQGVVCECWSNIFTADITNPYISTQGIIKLMAERPDVASLNISKLHVLSKILIEPQELPSIFTSWLDRAEVDIPIFWDTYKSIFDLVHELEFIEKYQFQYMNADAAEELYTLYQTTNPRFSNKLTPGLSLLKHVTTNRDYPIDVDEIMQFCEKLHSYLIHSLSVRLTKKTVIGRFKSYMEVFRAKDFESNEKVGEKEFQHEFEEFIFYQGLFPISETTLGNGRLDTLSISPDEGFLCELKQVGFGKTKETETNIESKVELGMHEPTIYQGRLADYPNLLPEVHVIVFTKIPIRLTDDYLYMNGLHYFFYIIDLSGISPSKQSNVIVVDPKEQFQAK